MPEAPAPPGRLAETEHGPLAYEIPTRLAWDDFFFPAETAADLKALVERWRDRPHVLESWGLGPRLKSHGVLALFSGEPGTGKTEAAALVAATLELRLFQVSTAALVSKYIGETEKNIDRVLRAAERRRETAALVFDEGETLFARRVDAKGAGELAHNSQIGLLLGRLERYGGLAMLTTNHPGRIDPAFQRRFQVHIEFSLPGPEERQRILRLCLAKAPLAADIDWHLLDSHDVSGGVIQNIVLNAAYLARARGLPHVDGGSLKTALGRELGKLGRLVHDTRR